MKYADGQDLQGWGFVGSSRLVRIHGGPRVFGMDRKVMSQHSYVPPTQLSELPVPVWEFQHDRTYRMSVDAGSEFQFTSLFTLATDVQKRHRDKLDGGLPLDDQQVQELVWIIDQLLAVVEGLHRQIDTMANAGHNSQRPGWSLGLTDPHNILYYFDRHRTARIALPDLFFVSAPSPIPPPWLTGREEFSFLWRNPEEPDLDVASLERQGYGPARDVRLVARLCAWVLTGEKGCEQRQDPRFVAGVWPILRGAALAGSDQLGAIETATEFRSRLWVPETGLALHFRQKWRLAEPKVDITKPNIHSGAPAPSGRLARWVAGYGLLACLLLLLLPYFTNRSVTPAPPLAPSWLCKNCAGDSPISVVLRERQEVLVQRFHQKYGYTAEDRAGLNFGLDTIQEQFTNLDQQFHNLQEVHSQISTKRELSADELFCLRQTEGDRFLEALGIQWLVLHESWKTNPVLQNIDMTPHFVQFRDLYNTSQKFFEGEAPSWYADYSNAMTSVIGLPLNE